jgi:[ribosomal protein S5]-alanine N-acetyltransferase
MLETKRLILIPLTYEQLLKYIKNDNSLETELNLQPTAMTISQDLKEAFEETILPNVADKSKNYLFTTLWTAISKAENKMVGDLCIYGEPNVKGEIEFGYGTHDEFVKSGLHDRNGEWNDCMGQNPTKRTIYDCFHRKSKYCLL